MTQASTTSLRDVALAILRAETLDGKLAPPPPHWTDAEPRGAAALPAAPTRPSELRIVDDPAAKRKVPGPGGMADPPQRARILHGLANHELQAIELFAWALLAFPDAPAAFRRGLVAILAEEQVHCRLYLERLAALGGRFGDQPVTGYFWSKAKDLTTPARFVAAMCLTFENANLDHAAELERAARAAGDAATADVLARVHRDEVRHVRFGWRWLRRFKDARRTMTQAYLDNVAWPLRPGLARGATFDPASRAAAGMDEEFITLLAGSKRPAARGARGA